MGNQAGSLKKHIETAEKTGDTRILFVLTQFFYLPLINTPGALSFSDQKLEKFPPELTKVIKSLTMIFQ